MSPRGKRVTVVPDDAEIIRLGDVLKMVKEKGQVATARELGLSESYISRLVRKSRLEGA